MPPVAITLASLGARFCGPTAWSSWLRRRFDVGLAQLAGGDVPQRLLRDMPPVRLWYSAMAFGDPQDTANSNGVSCACLRTCMCVCAFVSVW